MITLPDMLFVFVLYMNVFRPFYRSLYVICSGNRFSDFAKEKLVAQILFGQFNNNSPEDVKCVLRSVVYMCFPFVQLNFFFIVIYRQAFSSLERDYLHWIDEYLSQQSANSDDIKESADAVRGPQHILSVRRKRTYVFLTHFLNVDCAQLVKDRENFFRQISST